jgi:hypothetical protein
VATCAGEPYATLSYRSSDMRPPALEECLRRRRRIDTRRF